MKTLHYFLACVLLGQTFCAPGNQSVLTCSTVTNCVNKSLTTISLDCDNKRDIKKLFFDYNEIKEINSSQFEDLKHLQTLSLKGNRLEYVHESMFSDLRQLWSLNLNENNFTSINSSFFGNLPSLTKLQLSENQISTIYSKSFTKLNTLKLLYLQKNKIEIIEESAFAYDVHITYLYLENNSLKNVSFLQKLQSLHLLNISFNKIKKISKETFVNITNLTVIDCNHNDLIDLEFLWFLKSLEKLDLSWNSITTIRIDVLNQLVNLKSLMLGHNQITHIGSGTFSEMKRLEMIDISFNKIVVIGEILDNPAIKYVHLEHNQLTNISIPNNDNKTLYIDGNNWTCLFIKKTLSGGKTTFKYTIQKNTTNVRGIVCEDGFEIKQTLRKHISTDTPTTSFTDQTTTPAIQPVISENKLKGNTTFWLVIGTVIVLLLIGVSLITRKIKRRRKMTKHIKQGEEYTEVTYTPAQYALVDNTQLYSKVVPYVVPYSVTDLY